MIIKLGISEACTHSLMVHKDCSLPKKAAKVCAAFFRALAKQYTVSTTSSEIQNLINTYPESSFAKKIEIKTRKIEENPAKMKKQIPAWNDLTPCPPENKPKTDEGAEEESPECTIHFNTPKEMVMYNQKPYGYDALVKWYNENGHNPHNSEQYIDWNKVTKFEPLKPDQDTY